jgi:hypothetical protein
MQATRRTKTVVSVAWLGTAAVPMNRNDRSYAARAAGRKSAYGKLGDSPGRVADSDLRTALAGRSRRRESRRCLAVTVSANLLSNEVVDVLVVFLAHEVHHFGVKQRLHVKGYGPWLGEHLCVIDGHIDIETAEVGRADVLCYARFA